MQELYDRQRLAFAAMWPELAPELPDIPPEPPPVPAGDEATWRASLGPALATHAAAVVVLGFGDGSVLWRLLADPIGRTKSIHVVLWGGEEAAFAAALARPFVERLVDVRLAVALVRDHAGIVAAMAAWFPRHVDVTVLAGADLVDGHPLAAAAAATRDRLRGDLVTALTDRPQTYGNDIIDSFDGIRHSAANARLLLPAPSIGEMRGFFGDRPVVSIAAGPSVRRHLDALRRLQDRCVLVCCDAVLHGLIDAGIHPHFVTPLERVDMVRPMLSRAAESPRTIYAGLPVVVPDVVARFAGRAIGVMCGDALYEWLDPDCRDRVNSGLSTGVLAVTVACALTRGPVFLVGHDLAQTATDTHWDGAAFAKGEWAKGTQSSGRGAAPLSGYEQRLIPGNDGGLVASTAWWDRFREGIAHEAGQMAAAGRQVVNVNAHDRLFARIEHTVAGPLPDPGTLGELPPIALPPPRPERYAAWAERARRLPQDAEAFRAHLRRLRDDLAAMRRGPPAGWVPEALAARLGYEGSGVSDGNRLAFAYFLRSAVHNVNAEMHWRRRTANAAHARWRMLDSIDQAAQALDNALIKLATDLQRIADAHA